MNCHDLDRDLLMLVHRDLDRMATLRAWAHLAMCGRCRARLRQYQDLTGLLAANYRNPRLGVRGFAPTTPRGLTLLGLLTAILLLLGWMSASTVAATDVPTPAPPTLSCPAHGTPTKSAKSDVIANHSPRFCDGRE